MAGLFCLALLISACSSTPMTQEVLEGNHRLPQRFEITNTPFFPQEKYQCGPAALATLLHFRNQKTQPDELISKVYIPEKQGSVTLEMIAATRSYNHLAYPLDASLEKLLEEVASGNPVLVMQNLGYNWQPKWHYAVVVGYDLEKGLAVLRSGTEKRHITPLKTFERTWRRANYWALVVLPPDQIPATAEAPQFLKIAHQLEATGHTNAATQAYQTATQKWPDNGLPWLALGNVYYTQSKFKPSENSFRDGLARHPDNAELWNNLAYALSAQGCQSQAIKAVQCAVKLNPENLSFSDSLQEINKRTESTGQCKEVLCPTSASHLD